jgi:MoaA/NifB/PqqE/SkfB family radical SAM enzyme
MKPDVFRSIIDQMLAGRAGFNRDRIVIHGYGEPILSPYFFENLDYLQSKGFVNVDFSDNCMLMTREIVEKLCSYTVFNYIKLSLNSSRKELMERINTGSDF